MRTFGLICPGLVEIQVFEVSWVKFYGKRGKMSVRSSDTNSTSDK
jgi:hypothetical protein